MSVFPLPPGVVAPLSFEHAVSPTVATSTASPAEKIFLLFTGPLSLSVAPRRSPAGSKSTVELRVRRVDATDSGTDRPCRRSLQWCPVKHRMLVTARRLSSGRDDGRTHGENP